MPVADQAESVSVEYRLAMDWATALDGLPICYDDGAAFDEIFSTITLRLTPSELAAWEAIWKGARLVTFLDWTGLPLGPEIDVSGGVIEATLLDFSVDGPADASMTLFDAVAKLHYGPLPAPSSGSPAAIFAHGVPYHATRPDSKALHTDGATVLLVPTSSESDRSCTWYASGLTRDEVVSGINWLRTLRGASYAWTAAGQAFPFGPGESQTATIRIPSWKVSQESNFTWGIELEVVRIG